MTTVQDMNIPEEDEFVVPPVEDNGNVLKQRTTPFKAQLSVTSRNYDLKGKGFLDSEEQLVRKYDVDNDGVFTLEEAKMMAADLRGALLSKQQYRKLLVGCTVLLVVSWVGNFGLTYATVALTTKLNSQGGDLRDTSGNRVATKSKGNSLNFLPEFDSANPVDLRSLQSEDEFIIGTITKTRSEVEAMWIDHRNNVAISVTYESEGATHSKHVYPGSHVPNVSGINDENCDMYEGVTLQDNTISFDVKCCGEDTDLCDVYTKVSNGRSLTNDICFSSMSTVIEKTKGKMFLKDAQFGDSILAANGLYQPYVYDNHSHPSKPTEFVQIHTEESHGNGMTNTPIELTSRHMIFIDGKDVPILAGEIKLGDSLVGVNVPMKVTKITSIIRDGYFSPLTADATLFVNGILASSITEVAANNLRYLDFGLFEVHIHTFVGSVIAPLIHAFCSKIDSWHCKTGFDDGDGGSSSIWSATGRVIFRFPPLFRGLLLVLLPATGAVTFIAYHLFRVLAPITFVLSVIMAAQKNQLGKKYKLA